MHYKSIFAIAGVLLAIALVVPPVILILQAGNIALYSGEDNPGHQTSGNFTESDLAQSQQTSYIIAGAVEALFVGLFVVTLYYGINHMHPSHKRENEKQLT